MRINEGLRTTPASREVDRIRAIKRLREENNKFATDPKGYRNDGETIRMSADLFFAVDDELQTMKEEESAGVRSERSIRGLKNEVTQRTTRGPSGKFSIGRPINRPRGM